MARNCASSTTLFQFPGCFMGGSHRVVTFMCVWKLKNWNTHEFLFLSISSWFSSSVVVLVKEKNCNISSEGCTFRLAGVVLCPCPQWMGLLQHLLFGCMNNEDVKSQRSGKNSPGRQGVLLLGRSGLKAEPGAQSCFLQWALLGGCWSQPH